MNEDLEKYRARVEAQKEELADLLAQVGLGTQYDVEIRIPEDDEPLADLFVGLKLAADNLSLVSRQAEERAREAEEKAKTIVAQRQAIQELSTPVIEVWDEILILPLIGTIDTSRARQIIENLLNSIVRTQAQAAIIDITGVPVVDTKVANHLIKTVEAAKMLGADVILTGVSPHNAQTLVNLGVELGNIATKSSLQAGLRLAFELTKRKVVEDE